MFFTLQPSIIEMDVTQIANLQYFEFKDAFHSMQDRHNFHELLYVEKGALTIYAENYSGKLEENQMIIHLPNELHSLATSDNTTPNVIVIGFECSSEMLQMFAQKPVTLTTEQTRALARIMQEGMNIYEPPYDVPNTGYMPKRAVYPFGADQLIKIGLEAFLIGLVRNAQTRTGASTHDAEVTESVAAVRQYIDENFRTRITLANLCFLFGMNKTTLCRNFREAFGTTVLNYINELRIKEAKTYLQKGELSITEISDDLGFSSVHYFCRLFKQYTNQSPTEYAKSIHQE